MIAAAELAIQRQLTAAFVQADRILVTLVRSTPVSDGAGGTSPGTPTPLAAQVMRLIPLGDGAQERMTSDGREVRPAYKLLGLHTADMEIDDEFTIGGKRYQVVFISENRQYEVKGEVAFRG
jgi:hypothetical protein